MKKTLYSLFLIALITSCNTNKSEFNISFEIPEFEGKLLKVNKFDGSDLIVIDSLVVDSIEENILTGSVTHPELMYLSLEGERRPVRLFIENTGYTVTGSWNEAKIVTDGTVQQELNVYEAGLMIHRERMSELYQQYRTANQENNEAIIDSLVVLLEATDGELNTYDSIYITEHTGSYISVMALRNIFYKYDAEGLETMLNMLDEGVHQMQEYQYMEEKLINMKKVSIGQSYTDFGLETPEGNILKISDVHKGNVLLVDFWASWCGPCRRANPEIVALYNAYHEKGFDILGVSLDRDRESWLIGIETDKLTWHHISDLKYWNNEGAKLYGVSSIPHSVLLDKKGIIRAKNLSGEELRSKVEELLAE